jgi:prepilin-type N-terminal cleavage/methylation domain-containing protein
MKNKGFTLIELMVVILIVAILAGVLAPMLTGRVQQAKWSEAKAAAGTIATALRAYWAENEGNQNTGQVLSACTTDADFERIGLTAGDLDGKYFMRACYTTTALTTANAGTSSATPVYTITVTAANSTKSGHPTGTLTLTQAGVFTGP